MCQRHKIWDNDKLDIHSTGSSDGYAGHGHSDHGTHMQDYHNNKDYSSRDSEGKNDVYMSMKRHDESKKKEDEDKEKTIVDAVKQEEKYAKNKNHEEREIKEKTFHTATWDTRNNNPSDKKDDSETAKSKNNKSIEDAIKEAIKEEKEIVHID